MKIRYLLWLLVGLFCLPASLEAQQVSKSISSTSDVATFNLGSGSTVYGSISIQLSGTWGGTLQFESSTNGTAYSVVGLVNQDTRAFATTATSNAVFGFSNPGFINFRVTAPSWSSGTAQITMLPGSERMSVGAPQALTILANGGVAIFDPINPVAHVGSVIQLTGTWAGTVQFEATSNGSSWSTVAGMSLSTGVSSTTTAVNDAFRVIDYGYLQIRARATAWTSGVASAVFAGNSVNVFPSPVSNNIAPTTGVTDATYVLESPNASLINAFSLSTLASGLLVNTVFAGTGVPSAYPGSACGASQFVSSVSAFGVVTCSTPAGTGAPIDAQYWVGAADGTLTQEKNLGALGTGLVINTSGAPSAYTGSSCTPPNYVSAISASGVATCSTPSGTGSPTDATYITQTPNATLTNEQALSVLATGLLKSTTATGVISIAAADTDYSTPAGVETFTNKTYNTESTGNAFTIPNNVVYVTAICQGSTPTLGVSSPASNPAVANCHTGTNTQFATADFAAASNLSIQGHFPLPTDWSGAVDWRGKWFSATTTGNVVWQIATVCVGVGATSDPAFNTASSVTSAAQGTANRQQDASITAITVTGCSAGQELYWKISRNAGSGSDTMVGTAALSSVVFVVRRTI